MQERSESERSSMSPGERRSPEPDRRSYSAKRSSRSRSPSYGSAQSRRSNESYSKYNRRSRSRSNRKYDRHKDRSHRSRSPSHSQRYGRSRKSKSRSRSHSTYKSKRSRRSKSRSHSHTPKGERSSRSKRRTSSRRSHSTSPMSNRKRHDGDRDRPQTSKCLGVFGLSLYTSEREIKEHFNRYGVMDDVKVVYDHQSGRSRGFAFIYFKNLEDAEEAKHSAAGTEIDGRKIRVDYSITQRAHTPTPGIYLGQPTSYGGGNYGGGYRNRSPSPYARRGGYRYSRSRSRSRSHSRGRY